MRVQPRQQSCTGQDGKKYAFGGTSQQLIPEMRSSATDTGDKLFASANFDLQPFGLGVDFLMQLPGLSHFLLKGYPPAVLLISIGNESNKVLTNLLSENFKQIEDAFQSKGKLVIVEKNRLLVW